MVDIFLLSPKWINYETIYIYSKCLQQRKYQQLIKLFKDVEDKLTEKVTTIKGSNEEITPLD